MSRINVGTVVAGSGRNVIADVAKMEIEVRGETTEINQYMEEYAKNIIEGAAKLHQRDEGHGLCVFPDQRPGPYGPGKTGMRGEAASSGF